MVLISPFARLVHHARISYRLQLVIIACPAFRCHPRSPTETVKLAPSSTIDCHMGSRFVKVLALVAFALPSLMPQLTRWLGLIWARIYQAACSNLVVGNWGPGLQNTDSVDVRVSHEMKHLLLGHCPGTVPSP